MKFWRLIEGELVFVHIPTLNDKSDRLDCILIAILSEKFLWNLEYIYYYQVPR